MTDVLMRRTGLVLLVAVCNAGCASGGRAVPIVRPTTLAATRLADLRLPPGTNCLVQLESGETVRGKCDDVTQDELELRSRDATGVLAKRSIPQADVVLVARVVKMSKGARGCLGAAIGALVSLPFGISMVGDMMIPAALLGAVIGRSTGDERAEVVFERPQAPRFH